MPNLPSTLDAQNQDASSRALPPQLTTPQAEQLPAEPEKGGLPAGQRFAAPTLLPRARANLRPVVFFLALTLVFSIAYTQAPLYTSNQNQYFLHGAALAGLGNLRADWLANTLDPTPVFTFLVFFTFRVLRLPALFYIYYALLMGVYVFSLIGIANAFFPIRSRRPRFLVFLALLVAIHSAGLRFALGHLVGDNWTYVLEDGVADQRLLGAVFQPSVFAVFLMLSVYLFVRRRRVWAALSAALAATLHPTYLLGAALLVAGYCLAELVEACAPASPLTSLRKGMKPALVTGLAALAGVLPVAVYTFLNFGSTPRGTSAQAQEILINFRIPHHALLSWWFDATAAVKLILVVVALALLGWRVSRLQARPGNDPSPALRLFTALLAAFLGAVGLTTLQALTGSPALALLFPWRISIVLVPLSVALLLAGGMTALLDMSFLQGRRAVGWVSGLSLALLTACVLVGALRLVLDFRRQAAEDQRPLFAYVAAHRQAGELYLIPVKMQDFRLATGAPAYVEFKSIPYQDQDVLEWYRRERLADIFYQRGGCTRLEQLAQEGVNRVVLEASDAPSCPALTLLYRDTAYELYGLSQ